MFERLKKTILGNEKNKKIAFTIGWVSVILIILILAAGGGSTTPETDASGLVNAAEFNIGEMVFGTLIRLFLVLALIYGIFSIYRLFQKGSPKVHERRLQILDTHRFSAKQAVAILRIDNDEILIGLTDHQITLIKDLNERAEQDELLSSTVASNAKNFQEYLEEQNER